MARGGSGKKNDTLFDLSTSFDILSDDRRCYAATSGPVTKYLNVGSMQLSLRARRAEKGAAAAERFLCSRHGSAMQAAQAEAVA